MRLAYWDRERFCASALVGEVARTERTRLESYSHPKSNDYRFVGLIINVSAAFALARFREGGDANARAIWLFSRNDALANIAVIIAAGLAAWLQSAWPDLIVASIIAALFLHSAWEIVRDARRELLH